MQIAPLLSAKWKFIVFGGAKVCFSSFRNGLCFRTSACKFWRVHAISMNSFWKPWPTDIQLYGFVFSVFCFFNLSVGIQINYLTTKNLSFSERIGRFWHAKVW